MHIAIICITVTSCVNAKSFQSHLTGVNWENEGPSNIRRNVFGRNGVIGDEKQFLDEDDDNLGALENTLVGVIKSRVSIKYS